MTTMLTADVIRQRMTRVMGEDAVAAIRAKGLTGEDVQLAGTLKTLNAAASMERKHPLELHQAIYQLLGGEGEPRDMLDFMLGLKLMDELELLPVRGVSVGMPTPLGH